MSPKKLPGEKHAEKIGVSIPGDLFERLEKVKGRFNVSAVCRAALEAEVEYQELLAKGGKGMEALKTRLRAEKAQVSEIYVQKGRKQGAVDAQELSLEDFRSIASGAAPDKLEQWEKLSDEIHEMRHDDPDFDDDAYLRGWTEGVRDVWNQVKDTI